MMRCVKCGAAKENDTVCKVCGAIKAKNAQPGRGRKQELDESRIRREIPKGLLIALISMGAVLVCGVVLVVVLMLTQPGATASVGPTPNLAASAPPTETVSPLSTTTNRPE